MISISENNPFKKNYSLNIDGNLLDFEQAKVMGILNITPDSFFDGGKYPNLKSVLICELIISLRKRFYQTGKC